MGYTKQQLTDKWHEAKERIAELEGQLAERDKTIAELEERIKYEEAARKASNEAEQKLGAKVQKLEHDSKAAEAPKAPKTPRKTKAQPSSREHLSPEFQALLAGTKKRPSAISTNAVIDAALANFMAMTEPDADESKPERSYIELSASEDESDDGESDDESDDEGAPYGRSASGEYLDPDEEE